ncbi:MAG: SGNH/GDSL hydrolase family protein [Phaeodactylibacter sp.]|uniref:SGNH/GDSL hydrolase family protein n=1 Tax=Phaeodactylibacter sp. TaxID=1940289 RepID=UPI0032F0699A
MNDLKYIAGALVILPLLPVMYVQGRRIRASVPRLPPAAGPSGLVGKPVGTPFRLATLGESTIAGIGVATHKEGFSGTLASCIAEQTGRPVAWNVYAKSGYTAARVKTSLVPAMRATEADLIVIGLGGNDAFTLNAPWQWRRDIRELILELRNEFPQTPVVFTNMPPIRKFPAFTPLMKWVIGNHVELLGRELERIVAPLVNVYYYNRAITLEDWRERLNVSAPPSDFFSDGVHPSKLTYQVWARDFAGFIKEAGVIR